MRVLDAGVNPNLDALGLGANDVDVVVGKATGGKKNEVVTQSFYTPVALFSPYYRISDQTVFTRGIDDKEE